MTSAEWTGERLVPGKVDRALWNEHFARYAFASRYAAGRRVLDVGCGTGYGSAELARSAASVTGIDFAAEAVDHASSHYSGIRFVQGSASALPFPAEAFELIVSFEVIEHLPDWPQMLAEVRRVLGPDGLFVVSTPNRVFYERTRGEQGANPFHHHEFEYHEFRDALREHFSCVDIWLEDPTEAVAFRPARDVTGLAEGRFESCADTPENASFFVALCCNRDACNPGAPFAFVPEASNLLAEKLDHITRLEGEIRTKDGWLTQEQATHQELLRQHAALQEELRKSNDWALRLNERILALQEELAQEQAAARAEIERLNTELNETSEWARETEECLSSKLREVAEDRDRQISDLAHCVELLNRAEATLAERTKWAQDLDAELVRVRSLIAAAQASRWIKLGRVAGLGPELRER